MSDAKQKPRGRFYTVLILPHSRSRFRKLRLSRGFVWSVGGLAVLALAAALYSPHLLFKMQTQAAALGQLDQLLAENAQLREERERFDSRLDEIARQLSGVEDRTGEMAQALGLEGPASPQSAAGGPLGEDGASQSRRAVIEQELVTLRDRTAGLDGSVQELDRVFQQRTHLLAATPNGMPVEGWFSHGYGWRTDPITGGRQFHRGIDIVAEHGTPIRAPADGIVSRATRVSDYGKTIDLSHGFGYVTRYGHLSEILVRPGQQVRRGEVIGRVGSTGRSTGPHVHYEVFRDGRRVNPWKYLGR